MSDRQTGNLGPAGPRGCQGARSFEWTEDVPLVAVATDYAPFTARPAPTGRVVMLDPSSEMGFCLSLAALGLFEFYTKAEAPVAA